MRISRESREENPMRIKLVDSGHAVLAEASIPDFHRMPAVILWDCYGKLRTFVRWDPCDNEWQEAVDWTVRGSASELGDRAMEQVSRR